MTAHADIRTDHSLEQGFQLEDLRIDPTAGELAGPGGREKLDPKIMAVLVLMAQHAGHVVSREELHACLWPNAVVTDDALTRCFYELRRHLSQAGGSDRYKTMLETLPKRGYRLNGKVTFSVPEPAPRPPDPSNRRFKARAIAIVISLATAILLLVFIGVRLRESPDDPQSPAAVTAANSIAVLPFIDMSAGQDQGYLADGIAEEILNRLTQAGTLRVISRTSSFSFRDRPVQIPEIAAKLNVTHVLEGSVRQSGDSIRITAQLIAASDNSHVWSETYDRERGDLFAVQDEIATSVATALQVTLAGGAPHGRMPASVEAYERFLQGKFFYDRRAPGDIERAAKYYEGAVSIDPSYARAWAALAGAYSLLAWKDHASPGAMQTKQGEAARRAVELDPRLAVAHVRLAQFYFETSDYEQANIHRREALALGPNDLLVLGLTAEALSRENIGDVIAMQRRVVAQDPLAASHRTNLALLLVADGQLDEAMSEYRRVQELTPDTGLDVELEIVRVFVLQRRYDEAQSALAQFPEGKLRDHGLALLFQAPGRLAEADAALKRLAAHSEDMMDSIRLADAYAFRGMNDQAFAALQREKAALERNKDLGLRWVWHFREEIRVSPFLQPLHADPRWTALTVDPD